MFLEPGVDEEVKLLESGNAPPLSQEELERHCTLKYGTNAANITGRFEFLLIGANKGKKWTPEA
jgi:hypothetical protein